MENPNLGFLYLAGIFMNWQFKGVENWIFLEKENNFKRLLYKLKLRRVDSKNALEKQAQSSDVVVKVE